MSDLETKAGSVRAPMVLIVDPDATVFELMDRILRRVGCTVNMVRTGREALAFAKEHLPDAITLEVELSDIDGWAILAAIKGDPALAHIPVILVTIVDEKKRGYALGAADYLVKPVDRKYLAETLISLFSGDAKSMH